MSRTVRLCVTLGLLCTAAVATAVLFGETGFDRAQYAAAFGDPSSGPWDVLWQVRAPRAVCALVVGAALGLAGAVMQGLLRNPLADPGVLGVSATAALGAALAIVLGGAGVGGLVEMSALAGAAVAGGVLVAAAGLMRAPEALILFGVALSSFAGAATALIFNLSPSPIAQAEVMAWLLGSVQNRSWVDVAWVAPALAMAAVFAGLSARGLRMLTLGDETAAISGLSMGRLRGFALIAAALATGAAVAVAGVIGFVGLAAPSGAGGGARGRGANPGALGPGGRTDPGGRGLSGAADADGSGAETGGVHGLDRGAPVRPDRLAGGAGVAAVIAPLTMWDAQATLGGRKVLDGAHVQVERGRLVALVGPNGAGKSSLIKAFVGLLALDGGVARLDGDDVTTLSPRERARRVAYLPQERRIAWNLPAVEVAALGAPFLAGPEALARAKRALAEVGGAHLVDRGVAEMSGGERARVLLARALTTDAPMLLADEPIAGLDPDAQRLVLERLRGRADGGAGVLVSLHDLTLAAAFADQVVVMHQGQVAAAAPPMEALEPGVLRSVFGLDGRWVETPDGPLLAARRAQ